MQHVHKISVLNSKSAWVVTDVYVLVGMESAYQFWHREIQNEYLYDT